MEQGYSYEADRLPTRDFGEERQRKVGAAASYLATEVGQAEVAGKFGGSGPPTGGSAGVPGAERAAFLADLERAPDDVLLWRPKGRGINPQTYQAERQLFVGLFENLLTRRVCDTFEQPRGQECPHWPGWTKPALRTGQPRKPGCVEFIGDEPYSEPTPRQLDVFKDIDLTDEVIRLKSAAVREAIREYVPSRLFFQEWLPYFTQMIDRPAYFWRVWQSLDRMPRQFNFRPPELVAPDDTLRKYLEAGPNMARYVLSFAKNIEESRDHPELLLALSMFQASHSCFLENLYSQLDFGRLAGRVIWAQWANAEAVFEGPFRQFDDFMIFPTLLPLILLKRSELSGAAAGEDAYNAQQTRVAITQAWDIFIEKKILRRDFAAGGRMICPANQHLRLAKEHGAIEMLFDFVCNNINEMPIKKLLRRTRHAATDGIYNRVSNYWLGLAEAVDKNKDARGGQGLRLSKDK